MHALRVHRIHKSLQIFVKSANNYYNGCLHQLAAGSWDTKSHTDVTYTEPIRAKLNHNLKMPKIKIIPNYYKNIEKSKKLNLPRELIYLRDSYISPVGDIMIVEKDIRVYYQLYLDCMEVKIMTMLKIRWKR